MRKKYQLFLMVFLTAIVIYIAIGYALEKQAIKKVKETISKIISTSPEISNITYTKISVSPLSIIFHKFKVKGVKVLLNTNHISRTIIIDEVVITSYNLSQKGTINDLEFSVIGLKLFHRESYEQNKKIKTLQSPLNSRIDFTIDYKSKEKTLGIKFNIQGEKNKLTTRIGGNLQFSNYVIKEPVSFASEPFSALKQANISYFNLDAQVNGISESSLVGSSIIHNSDISELFKSINLNLSSEIQYSNITNKMKINLNITNHKKKNITMDINLNSIDLGSYSLFDLIYKNKLISAISDSYINTSLVNIDMSFKLPVKFLKQFYENDNIYNTLGYKSYILKYYGHHDYSYKKLEYNSRASIAIRGDTQNTGGALSLEYNSNITKKVMLKDLFQEYSYILEHSGASNESPITSLNNIIENLKIKKEVLSGNYIKSFKLTLENKTLYQDILKLYGKAIGENTQSLRSMILSNLTELKANSKNSLALKSYNAVFKFVKNPKVIALIIKPKSRLSEGEVVQTLIDILQDYKVILFDQEQVRVKSNTMKIKSDLTNKVILRVTDLLRKFSFSYQNR